MDLWSEPRALVTLLRSVMEPPYTAAVYLTVPDAGDITVIEGGLLPFCPACVSDWATYETGCWTRRIFFGLILPQGSSVVDI